MSSLNGLQTAGLQGNTIDGLTNVNTTALYINGVLFTPASYVPYTGATTTVNLNAKTLTNIANSVALTDAVNQQTMNAKDYIGTKSGYSYDITTVGNMKNTSYYTDTYLGGLLCYQDFSGAKYSYGQVFYFYTTAALGYGYCGAINAISTGSMDISSTTVRLLGTNILLIGAIGITGIITGNLNQIKNIADPSSAQDVSTKNYTDTKVPYTGATANVDLNAKQLKNIANGSASQDAVALNQLTSYIPTQIVNGLVSVVCGTNDITNTTSTSGTIISIIGNGGVLTNYNNGWYQSLTSSFPTYTRTWGINVASSSNAIEFTHTATGTGVVGFFNFTRKVKVQPIANSTDVLTIANAVGTTIFSVDTSTPAINAGGCKINNVLAGTASTDAVNVSQLSGLVPAGTVQGSYIIHNGTAYINNATTTVNLGNLSGNTATNATNVGSEAGKTSQATETVAIGFQAGKTTQGAYSVAVGSNAGADRQISGAVAIGPYAGAIIQGNSAFGSPIINLDASALSLGTITSWTNTGSQTAGPATISAGGTVINSGYIGSLREVSLPSTTTFNCPTGIGILYPNITVASVYRVNASAGFFLQQGTYYANPQSFYFSNGIPYGGGTVYYTSVNYSGTNYDIDSFTAGGPGSISPGSGRTSYIIQILTTSNATQRVQYYVYDVLLGTYTKYGPYSRANGGSLGNTLGTLPLTINQTNAAQVFPCQILIYNSTFSLGEMNQLEQFLINKWFRRTTTVDTVAIGNAAGYLSQNYGAVAIGANAGALAQGQNAIAIGNLAGYSSQVENSIIINASGVALNPTKAGCYISGLRTTKAPPAEYDTDAYRGAQYNSTTKELCYNATQIWNVIVIGQATSDPSATLPLVYFMPSGMTITSSSYTCSVVRNSQGDYTLTFSGLLYPNFGTYTTITVGTNTVAPYTDVYMAKWTSTNTIRITSVLSLVAYRDLLIGNNMSLRIEF